jgi:hypothetical protein
MNMIPKVKTVKCRLQIGTGIIEDRLSSPGEYQSGKLPAGGFQSVWNFKMDQPNDYFTRKNSPTSGGGKKVY